MVIHDYELQTEGQQIDYVAEWFRQATLLELRRLSDQLAGNGIEINIGLIGVQDATTDQP